MHALKSIVRKIYYRSAAARAVIGHLSVLAGRTKPLGTAHLLSYREDDAIGPLQRDEATAMFGIVRTIRPKLIVEFGFFHGHSAFNFLQAMPPDARLFSYDIDPDSKRRAHDEFAFEKRFTFIAKSQTEFEPGDIGGGKIDLVFFDAAHELELNMETFKSIAACLSPDAMIAVHDTGLWNREHFGAIHEEFVKKHPVDRHSGNLIAHQPGERAFIDWITDTYQEFNAIHFHSTATLRHGFTLLQRRRRLSQVL